jgi:hypothetical protein
MLIFMKTEEALSIVNRWVAENLKEETLLFKADPEGSCDVSVDLQQLVRRSEELTRKLVDIKKQIRGQCLEQRCPEGICYFIYRRNDEKQVEPLYIGISETIGKKRKVSSLFTGGWARFGEELNSNGHIGNINEVIHCRGARYKHWCDRLFEPGYSPGKVTLSKPVYVGIDLWRSDSCSMLKSLGHTSLKLEEMLRLHLWRLAGFAGTLLNKDGNRQNAEATI